MQRRNFAIIQPPFSGRVTQPNLKVTRSHLKNTYGGRPSTLPTNNVGIAQGDFAILEIASTKSKVTTFLDFFHKTGCAIGEHFSYASHDLGSVVTEAYD